MLIAIVYPVGSVIREALSPDAIPVFERYVTTVQNRIFVNTMVLGNSLTAVALTVDSLLEALDDPEMDEETRTRFVERAAHETERLEALIGDILFLSELEATQGLPSAGRSDLSVAVAETVDELEGLADDMEEFFVAVDTCPARAAAKE